MSSPTAMIFGRYAAIDSPVHAMDARCKLTLLLVYIIATICTSTPMGLALCTLFTFGFYCAARIPVRTALTCVAPLMIIVILTAIANLFFVQGGETLVTLGPLGITENGLHQAIFMSVRLTVLLFGACLITLTTTALDITDAFESMLMPFARFGLPAHELAMIAGIALRFLPQFATELINTRNAQASRGASFTEGSLRERAHAFSALFVPLFASVFRHADTLAAGMDARCYHGGTGRTRLNQHAFHRRDALACAIVALQVAGIIVCSLLGV